MFHGQMLSFQPGMEWLGLMIPKEEQIATHKTKQTQRGITGRIRKSLQKCCAYSSVSQKLAILKGPGSI